MLGLRPIAEPQPQLRTETPGFLAVPACLHAFTRGASMSLMTEGHSPSEDAAVKTGTGEQP